MKKKSFGAVESVLVILILFLVFKIFVLQTFRIESDSMRPVLYPGDHVAGLSRFLSFGFSLPMPFREGAENPRASRIHRGDIVVFKPPVPGNEEYVKRVIALQGERVMIRSDKVLINGTPLDEPYAFVNMKEPHLDSMDEVTVEPGHIFVMGDNRNHSSDSRSWGTVPISQVESRIFLLLLPVKRLKILR